MSSAVENIPIVTPNSDLEKDEWVVKIRSVVWGASGLVEGEEIHVINVGSGLQRLANIFEGNIPSFFRASGGRIMYCKDPAGTNPRMLMYLDKGSLIPLRGGMLGSQIWMFSQGIQSDLEEPHGWTMNLLEVDSLDELKDALRLGLSEGGEWIPRDNKCFEENIYYVAKLAQILERILSNVQELAIASKWILFRTALSRHLKKTDSCEKSPHDYYGCPQNVWDELDRMDKMRILLEVSKDFPPREDWNITRDVLLERGTVHPQCFTHGSWTWLKSMASSFIMYLYH